MMPDRMADPHAVDGAGERPPASSAGGGPQPSPKKHTVLVADDDDELRDALIDLLDDEAKYQVIAAKDGTEALHALRSEKIDAAVLDHRMPGLMGADVVRRAREEGLKTPIIFVTAASEIRAIARDLGIDCFLGKPFDVDALIALLTRALSGHC